MRTHPCGGADGGRRRAWQGGGRSLDQDQLVPAEEEHHLLPLVDWEKIIEDAHGGWLGGVTLGEPYDGADSASTWYWLGLTGQLRPRVMLAKWPSRAWFLSVYGANTGRTKAWDRTPLSSYQVTMLGEEMQSLVARDPSSQIRDGLASLQPPGSKPQSCWDSSTRFGAGPHLILEMLQLFCHSSRQQRKIEHS